MLTWQAVSGWRNQNVPASRPACTTKEVPLKLALNTPDDTPPVMDANDPMMTPLEVAGFGEQEKAEPLRSIVLGPVCVHVNVTTLGVDPSAQLLVPDVSSPVPSAKNAIFVKQVPCPQLSPSIRQ